MDYEELKNWVNDNNPFMEHNGIRITRIWKDGAEAEGTVTADLTNPYHMAHGGFQFTLADVCSGAAARSDGRSYVTQQASVSFLRAGREKDTIHAAAHVIHRGRSICLINVKVTDGSERLLFDGQFTYFCISDKSSQETRRERENRN